MSYNYTLLANDTYRIAGALCGDLVDGVLTIPNTYNGKNITEISLFNNCSGIIEVVMPNTITGINNASFHSCINLKKITFSNNLTSIGANVFVGCTGLSSMELPNSLVFIGNSAFFNCFSLTGVSIPSGVTLIRQQTFSNCTGLKMISMSDNITGIEFSAFSNCRNLNDFKFSNNLKYIAGSAFQRNVNLKSVILPDTLNKLDLFSFGSCSGINNFILSKSLTGISSFLLVGNDSLKNIKIPSNIKNIESYGLYGILNLENIYFEGNFPTTGDSSIGLNSPNLKLYRKKNFTTGWPDSVQGVPVVLWSDNVIKGNGSGKLIAKKRTFGLPHEIYLTINGCPSLEGVFEGEFANCPFYRGGNDEFGLGSKRWFNDGNDIMIIYDGDEAYFNMGNHWLIIDPYEQNLYFKRPSLDSNNIPTDGWEVGPETVCQSGQVIITK